MKKKAIEKALMVFKNIAKTVPVEIEPIFRHYGLQLVKKDLDDKVSGMLVLNADQKIVIINQNQSLQRQRFTAMHELGHFILHQDASEYFIDMTVEWRRENTEGLNRAQEVEANSFAANLLMPEQEIERVVEEQNFLYLTDDEISKMAKIFKVSRPAMKVRLVSLGYIPDWDVEL